MIYLLKLIKYWPFVLIVAAILAVGVKFTVMQNKISKLEHGAFQAAVDIEALERERDVLREKVATQNAAVMKLYEQNREYETEVSRLSLIPPQKVIEYRETIREVERGITSGDCVTAIGEALRLLRDARNDNP
jgi:SMC interacting uncharacterized protein involved in chromosome segregation